MIPIGDDNSDRLIFPLVNLGLIAACILVFVFFQGLGTDERFTMAWSTVPAEILSGQDLATEDSLLRDPESGRVFQHPDTGEPVVRPGLQEIPAPVYLTLIVSLFMHGGLAHLFGNMLYLWIFGDNIENALGHGPYLLFYLVVGVIASLSYVAATYLFGGDPLIPSLGASGAIAGVQGAYLMLFPKRRVRMLLFRAVVDVPAIVAVGVWFLFQLFGGYASAQSGGDGVAYSAHIGGFIAGLLFVRLFLSGRSRPEAPHRYFGPHEQRRPGEVMGGSWRVDS